MRWVVVLVHAGGGRVCKVGEPKTGVQFFLLQILYHDFDRLQMKSDVGICVAITAQIGAASITYYPERLYKVSTRNVWKIRGMVGIGIFKVSYIACWKAEKLLV